MRFLFALLLLFPTLLSASGVFTLHKDDIDLEDLNIDFTQNMTPTDNDKGYEFHVNLNVREAVFSAIQNLPEGGMIYEIGGGYGSFLLEYYPLALEKSIGITFCDLSETQTRIARQRLSEEYPDHTVTFKYGDFLGDSIESSSVDLFICRNVYHFEDPERQCLATQKIHTASVPNGKFIGCANTENYDLQYRDLIDVLLKKKPCRPFEIMRQISCSRQERRELTFYNYCCPENTDNRIGNSIHYVSLPLIQDILTKAGFSTKIEEFSRDSILENQETRVPSNRSNVMWIGTKNSSLDEDEWGQLMQIAVQETRHINTATSWDNTINSVLIFLNYASELVRNSTVEKHKTSFNTILNASMQNLHPDLKAIFAEYLVK